MGRWSYGGEQAVFGDGSGCGSLYSWRGLGCATSSMDPASVETAKVLARGVLGWIGRCAGLTGYPGDPYLCAQVDELAGRPAVTPTAASMARGLNVLTDSYVSASPMLRAEAFGVLHNHVAVD